MFNTTGQDRITITCDKHTFNFVRKQSYTFLVVADEASGREVPYAFLERVSEDFLNTHASKGSKAAAAGPLSLGRSFVPKLKQHMVSVHAWGRLQVQHKQRAQGGRGTAAVTPPPPSTLAQFPPALLFDFDRAALRSATQSGLVFRSTVPATQRRSPGLPHASRK